MKIARRNRRDAKREKRSPRHFALSKDRKRKEAFHKNSQKYDKKIVIGVKGGEERTKRCGELLDKPAKFERNIDNFLKMEDVLGKKVLDFFGRIVHNDCYPSNSAKKSVAKRTQERGEERQPDQLAAASRRNEYGFRRIS